MPELQGAPGDQVGDGACHHGFRHANADNVLSDAALADCGSNGNAALDLSFHGHHLCFLLVTEALQAPSWCESKLGMLQQPDGGLDAGLQAYAHGFPYASVAVGACLAAVQPQALALSEQGVQHKAAVPSL